MSRGIISTRFGPLIHEHTSLLANLNIGMESSVAAAVDLDEACLDLEEEQDALIMELESTLESYYKNVLYFNAQKDILDKIQQDLTNGILSVQEIENSFTSQIKELKKNLASKDLKQSEYYQELQIKRKELRGVSLDSQDDDILVVSQKESFKCPITQLLLVDPVISVKCGHIFSKKAIMELISRNQELECPKAGCRHFVKASDLKADKKISRLVASEKRKLMLESEQERNAYMTI